MGDNIMIYLDDIQHCHPEFLQKFISLCDAQRKVEQTVQEKFAGLADSSSPRLGAQARISNRGEAPSGMPQPALAPTRQLLPMVMTISPPPVLVRSAMASIAKPTTQTTTPVAARGPRGIGAAVVIDSGLTADTLPGAVGDTDVLIVRSTKVTAETIAAAPSLSLIVRAGAGVNQVQRIIDKHGNAGLSPAWRRQW